MVRTANLARAAALSALLMVAANAWSLPSFVKTVSNSLLACARSRLLRESALRDLTVGPRSDLVFACFCPVQKKAESKF